MGKKKEAEEYYIKSLTIREKVIKYIIYNEIEKIKNKRMKRNQNFLL
jgi:hypothetical protein